MIFDLHIHSRFSRACSKDLNIKNLEKWARVKGVDVLGTGDFTHPEWLKELKQELADDGSGIYRTKGGFPFVLQVEISQIYTQDRGRRIHNVILAPSFEVVDQVNEYLGSKGRMDYDGRPIFKLPCDELLENLREISTDIELIPAHVWTPWFSLFGSKSGFDSVEEAFKDQSKHINALETGLSSDPPMNRLVSGLDKYNLVSFSDAHSFWPWRLGREATIMDLELSYKNIIKAVRTGDGLKGTIEVDPNYGKYHVDGHRACGVAMEPRESRRNNNICPVCKKELTLGVLYRVEQLSDRETPGKQDYHKKLLPLSELISAVTCKGLTTKSSWEVFWKLIKEFGNEYNVLLKAKKEELVSVVNPQIADAITQNREGTIKVTPGYDGVYGVPQLNPVKEKDIDVEKEQKGLKDFF